MSEYDKSRKIANETLEKGKAAAEQTARSVEQSYSVTVDNIRDFNVKMIDMAQANAEAVFEFARRLAAVGEINSIFAKAIHCKDHVSRRGAFLS